MRKQESAYPFDKIRGRMYEQPNSKRVRSCRNERRESRGDSLRNDGIRRAAVAAYISLLISHFSP
jgi:hypothetical protein